MAYSKTILVGNMTKDPEKKITQNGKTVCSFSVAVKRRFQDVTDFHDCVAWGNTADAICRNLHKGKEILVEGELQKRSYEKDGIKRWVTELVVEAFSFTGRKDDGESEQKQKTWEEVEAEEDDLPF